MRVWAVANQKGGVGKTTTTVALGSLLAAQGKRVLMLDLDPQGSLGSYFGHAPEYTQGSSYEWFTPPAQLPQETLLATIRPTDAPRLSLVPGSTSLATLERTAITQEGMGLAVSRALASLWDHFDYVIIDSPPTLGVLLINALAASSLLVVPVQTEFLAIKGVERMLNTLQMVNRSRRKKLPYLMVPTLFDRRTQAGVASFRYLRRTWPEQVWQSAVPVDTRLRDASSRGVTPLMLDPQSRGIQAYGSLLKTLLKMERAEMEAEASQVEAGEGLIHG